MNIPWPLKVAAKIVLSRLPIPYGAWSRLNLFKHGEMKDLSYARFVFDRHFEQSALARGRSGFTCLELGPGDSLLSALLARSAGATHTYIVDTGAFANASLDLYREVAASLPSGVTPLHPERWTSIDAMLEDCQAEYLTNGIASLRTVPTGSVDWSWSQAVLEHVRRSEFHDTMRELHRVSRPGAISSHRIDLQDHLGGRLNSLRFSESAWEGALLSNSGFYTNRLRRSELIGAMEVAGFAVRRLVEETWTSLPTPRGAMDAAFQRFPDDELKVRWIDVTLEAGPR